MSLGRCAANPGSMGLSGARLVPGPYPTREEAVTAIECIVSMFANAGYEPTQKFWWTIAHDGERTRFIIEGVLISRPESSPQLGS